MFSLEARSKVVQELLSPYFLHMHAILQTSFTRFLTAKQREW